MKASQVNDQYVDLLRIATPATPSQLPKVTMFYGKSQEKQREIPRLTNERCAAFAAQL